MIALIQRVSQASVTIAGETVGEINHGLLVLLGIQHGDTAAIADKLLHKVLSYRVFADEAQRMNLNVQQAGGQLLIVSQFTKPDAARELYDYFCAQSAAHIATQTGEFAADMQVSLVNDGPVTFWLQVE